MDEEEEYYPMLSLLGWQFVEVCERMMAHKFSMEDICDAWDVTPAHIYHMLARARAEREMLFNDLSS
jgi:hypothetical protein